MLAVGRVIRLYEFTVTNSVLSNHMPVYWNTVMKSRTTSRLPFPWRFYVLA